MPPNPFTDAQNQAASNGYANEPPIPPGPTGVPSFNPPPPDPAAGSMQPAQFYSGSMDEIGSLRDSIMSQFPSINNATDEDLGFSAGEKLGSSSVALLIDG